MDGDPRTSSIRYIQCSLIQERAGERRPIDPDNIEFCASDETIDRYGDIIKADGWKLETYKQNPIVLFGHSAMHPIGTASVRIEKKRLLSTIDIADEGTSETVDAVRKLVPQRVLRAVSVGFLPLSPPKYRRDAQNDEVLGYEYDNQELLEISVVSVPANPNALTLARSLNLSAPVLSLLFKSQSASAQIAQRRRQVERLRLGVPSRTFSYEE